jgi:2-methylcitrate dehydratase
MSQATTEPLTHQQGEHVRPAVERIAAFAADARPEHLTHETRHLFKRNILDSLGCAIAALPGQPFQSLREQFGEYRAPGRCTLIGGGKTSADQAALFNSGLVRYVDLLDSYMAVGGLCHPSDNFGTVLAAAEQAGASGEEFMLALNAGSQRQSR